MGMVVVKVRQGLLEGLERGGYTEFRGIPFARPPVGELRWREPQEPEAWEGIRPAREFGPRCPQRHCEPGTFYHKEFFSDPSWVPPMGEDCLYLNVWTPAEGSGEDLPVALWIHGGAFLGGYGSEPEFDGAAFCGQGVVLVTVNYRVGALGFLSHPWLSEENSGRSGNYGILDQIATLRWVRENIAAFGGDPERITLFGQSAGCMSVQTLISSPLTRGMVRGAILQSAGGYRTGFNRDKVPAQAEAEGVEFAGLCGVESLAELRALPADRVVELAQEWTAAREAAGNSALPFVPLIDGRLLTAGYDQLVEEGGVHPIPYLIGSTKDDIAVEGDAPGERSRLYRGCVEWSLKNEEKGIGPSYVYHFIREPLGGEAGAFHSAELWYVFGTLGRSWRPKVAADYDLSQRMVRYWCNFIKSGDPNGGDLPFWRPCAAQDPYVHTLG